MKAKRAASTRRRPLSPRQQQVARLLRKGYTQGAVAVRLGISLRTVEVHAAAIREKAGAATTLQALYPSLKPEDVRPPDPPRLSPRIRFLVLSRDGFACRYCGRKPPLVALDVDHVIPRAAGGSDDPSNLAASCEDCNSGKGAHPLTVVDSAAPENFHK